MVFCFVEHFMIVNIIMLGFIGVWCELSQVKTIEYDVVDVNNDDDDDGDGDADGVSVNPVAVDSFGVALQKNSLFSLRSKIGLALSAQKWRTLHAERNGERESSWGRETQRDRAKTE